MVPFRVFDKEAKQLWLVVNYHASSDTYLMAQEDDAERDYALVRVESAKMEQYRFIDFVEGADNAVD